MTSFDLLLLWADDGPDLNYLVRSERWVWGGCLKVHEVTSVSSPICGTSLKDS